jgi:hypothetical protein
MLAINLDFGGGTTRTGRDARAAIPTGKLSIVGTDECFASGRGGSRTWRAGIGQLIILLGRTVDNTAMGAGRRSNLRAIGVEGEMCIWGGSCFPDEMPDNGGRTALPRLLQCFFLSSAIDATLALHFATAQLLQSDAG